MDGSNEDEEYVAKTALFSRLLQSYLSIHTDDTRSTHATIHGSIVLDIVSYIEK